MRNQPFLPDHIDKWDFVGLSGYLQNHAGTLQAERIELILNLLISLAGEPKLSTRETMRYKAALGSLLRDYQWTYYINPGPLAALAPTPMEKPTPPGADHREYGYVRFLLELTRYPGALSRIRQCAYSRCERWFYAAKKNQKWCTKEYGSDGMCRQRDYYSDPKHKAKHREAVRESQKRIKEMRERARKRAQQDRAQPKRRRARGSAR